MSELPSDVERFLAYLRLNERLAPETLRVRRAALTGLCRYLQAAGVDVLDADEATLLGWQASLGCSDGTLAGYTSAVRRLYGWLASPRSGRAIPFDPSTELPSPHVVYARRGAMSDDDLERALLAAPTPRLRTWMLLEAGTGIRPCQIASLTKHRVSYQRNGRALLNVRGKGREMTVVAGSYVAADLRQWTSVAHGPLWYNSAGVPVRPANIIDSVNKHLASLGIEETTHALRRWFTANAFRLTHNDARTVQELLGHASLDTTMLYLPVDETAVTDVAVGIADRLAAAERGRMALGGAS
jgi:site-specific recombinase XerD